VDKTVPLEKIPPTCPYCGGLIRPAVVWFGEAIDNEILAASSSALDCNLFLAVGTSAVVFPAAGLVNEAHRRGAFTAEINMEVTPASETVDLSLMGPAEQVLQQVEDMLQHN